MIEIEDTVLSGEVISCHFACDLSACKGACCVHGDSGAPLEKHEAESLEQLMPKIIPYLSQRGIDAIASQGTSTVDAENDTVTPLVEGKECAYAVFEDGIARCGIEKAYLEGAISFRKPSSCHLYPIRIKKYKTFDAINYDRWEICEPAIRNGFRMQLPLYRFVRDALIGRYGEAWFSQLERAAKEIKGEAEHYGQG